MEERSRELDLELGYKGANLKKSISIFHFLAIAVISTAGALVVITV